MRVRVCVCVGGGGVSNNVGKNQAGAEHKSCFNVKWALLWFIPDLVNLFSLSLYHKQVCLVTKSSLKLCFTHLLVISLK